MDRLDLNIKVRQLMIADRKYDDRDTKELEWFLEDVVNCQKAVLAGLKKVGKVIDAYCG